MPLNYLTAISHAVLGTSCLYCLTRMHSNWKLAQVSYGITIINSCLGILYFGADLHAVEEYYYFTRLIQTVFSFPCLVGQMWINYGYSKPVGFLHPALALIPHVVYVHEGRLNQDIVDGVHTANFVSCLLLCVSRNNWYGIFASLGFDIVHLTLKLQEEIILDMENEDTYNYGYCLFSLLGQVALESASLAYIVIS